MSPYPDQSQFCVGIDVGTVDWSQFSQIYLFPPVPILDFLFQKIEAYQGRAFIITPPIGHVLAVLSRRALWSRRLPESSFLFQYLPSGEMIRKRKFYDYWMWLLLTFQFFL